MHVQRDKRDGFGSDISYANGYKAWKFYDPVSRKVLISERADFDTQFECS